MMLQKKFFQLCTFQRCFRINLPFIRNYSTDKKPISSPRDHNDFESFLSKSCLDHVEEIDFNLYRSRKLWKYRAARGAYGGQIAGQALFVACKSVLEHHHLHSFHSYFLKPGDCDIPVLYHVDNTRDGKTYSSRTVKATQNGKAIFTMEASFKMTEDSSLSYQVPMQEVPAIEEVPDFMQILNELDNEEVKIQHHISRREFFEAFPIEARWLDPEDSLFRSPRKPTRRLWIRTRGSVNANLNNDIHKCCLAYITDLFMISTSLLPHAPLAGKKAIHASIDHCMWFYALCRADEWMLFEIRTESIGDGRSFIHGLIWDQKGTLVSTVTQEGVLRVIS